MASLHDSADVRITRYFLFVRGRNEGLTETELAEKFDRRSARELYCELNEHGFPVCVQCGSYEPKERRCATCLPRDRRPRGSTDAAVELPAADVATDLFERAEKLLNMAIQELPYSRQWLKDRRVVTEHRHTEESGRSNLRFVRNDFGRSRSGEARWKKWCARYGKDPAIEEFKVPIATVIGGGADWYPHDLLVWLVAAYAVTGGPMDDLLSLLHPAPNAQDAAEADRKRDELLLRARQLAGLVRGSPEAIKAGRKAKSVLPYDQELAWALEDEDMRREYEQAGMSGAQIAHLRELRLPTGEDDRGQLGT